MTLRGRAGPRFGPPRSGAPVHRLFLNGPPSVFALPTVFFTVATVKKYGRHQKWRWKKRSVGEASDNLLITGGAGRGGAGYSRPCTALERTLSLLPGQTEHPRMYFHTCPEIRGTPELLEEPLHMDCLGAVSISVAQHPRCLSWESSVIFFFFPKALGQRSRRAA